MVKALRLAALLLHASSCGDTTGTLPAREAYVGSATCLGCHPNEHHAWTSSHHAQAERTRPDTLAAFDDPSSPRVVMLDGQGHTHEEAVARIIGVDPLWQPLIEASGGRLQASSMAWDVHKLEWFDIFEGDPRTPGDWGHWTGRGMTWNSMCAACHNTGVQIGWDSGTDTYNTTIAEQGVGCEGCHGPSSAHAAHPTTPTPGTATPQLQHETCEGCHVRWTPASDHHVPGKPLLDHGIPVLPGMDPGWYPDGGVLYENFEATAFRQSKMYAAGIRCTSCHDAHTAELVRPPPALCTGCHVESATFDPNHHRHDNASATPTCVDCHMPTTVYMGRHTRHDHGFAIPDVGLAVELKTNVSCAACHDLTPALIETAEAWWPPNQTSRARTRALAAAWSGRDATCADLLPHLNDDASPAWIAIIGSTLARCGETDRTSSLLQHDSPWVRSAVAGAVQPVAATIPGLLQRLDDPVRAVRLQAARALQRHYSPLESSMSEYVAHLTRLGDHAVAAAELGSWWSAHRRPDQALVPLRRAARLDPRQPEIRRALATVLSALGRHGDAVMEMEEACALDPRSADLQFERALALAAAGRAEDAKAALQRALQLDPNHGRAAYNLGLLLNQLGDAEMALQMLERASRLLPDDPSPPYAASTIHLQAGDTKSASHAAQEALRRNPRHDGARRVLSQAASPP